MSDLWPNLEERRTVVGPDADGICEASIRLEANLPIRFIYQKKSTQSLERREVVFEIFSGEICTLIASHHYSGGLRDFCVSENDIVSELTPISVFLSRGISVDEIVGKGDIINGTTKRIFNELKKQEGRIKAMIAEDNAADATEEVIDGLLKKAEKNQSTGFLTIDWNK